ncbi:MAG: hypothetical protein JWQ57_5128 [Mucilaginibacter sp.]|nr:hypothetical protein [Mucilaginibacter sp.]
MNDHSQITPVTFNEATRKFNFELRPSACGNLLLTYYNQMGITLCHSDKNELDAFRQKLISLNDGIDANHSERRGSKQRKMIAALLIAVFVCLFVYSNDFVGDALFYRWLFNFGTILILFILYKIAVKYLFGKNDYAEASRLQRDLDLLVIYNRIRDEFSC